MDGRNDEESLFSSSQGKHLHIIKRVFALKKLEFTVE